MKCEDMCQTVKPVNKRSNSYPTKVIKMTEPCIDKRELTRANGFDGFLLIKTNFEVDLILGYGPIEEPNVVSSMHSSLKSTKCCDWIDHLPDFGDRKDSMLIRISEFNQSGCRCKFRRLLIAYLELRPGDLLCSSDVDNRIIKS